MLASLDISGIFAQISNPVAQRVQQRAQRVASNRPSSKKFWAEYTKVSYDTISDVEYKKVWEFIGGNVGEKYQNEYTCAARMSYGLTHSGAEIPSIRDVSNMNYKDKTFKGNPGDGKRYIIKAGDMNSYLRGKWGVPDFEQVANTTTLKDIVSGFQADQVALFATKNTPGHAGAIKKGYKDPYVNEAQVGFQVDVWKLPVP